MLHELKAITQLPELPISNADNLYESVLNFLCLMLMTTTGAIKSNSSNLQICMQQILLMLHALGG